MMQAMYTIYSKNNTHHIVPTWDIRVTILKCVSNRYVNLNLSVIRFIQTYGSIISFLIFYGSLIGYIILLPPEVVL